MAEEGDSEEGVVVSMPQPPPHHQCIFNLRAGPRAPRAKLEGLWYTESGREKWTHCTIPWRLFSSKPVSRAVPLIWDHLQRGGGISSKGQCANPWNYNSSGNPAAENGTAQDRRAAGVWLEGHTEVFWGFVCPQTN